MLNLRRPFIASKIDSCSSTSFSSTMAGAASAQDNHLEQHSRLSGFGSVMEQERDLQSSTSGYVGADNGVHAVAIDRILRNQGARLEANITLLEQRYEMLPQPSRFKALQGTHRPLTKARRVPAEEESLAMLPDLVAQHTDVLEKIARLMAHRSDGQRGEMILAEIARNHEDMLWMLTALINDDATVRDLIPMPTIAISPPPSAGETAWENEGGAPRVPPASRAV